MTSLEKICEQCVGVCGVPIKLSKTIIINQVERYLRHGRVMDTDKVGGIESDRNLTRLVLLLGSEEDAEHLCKEIRQEEVQTEGETFIVKYQKAIACELPERWGNIKMQKPGDELNQASGGIQQPGQVPTPPVRSQKETPSETNQLPNVWPAGRIGPASGFYHNIPPYLQGGGARQMQGAGSHVQSEDQMPQTTANPDQGQGNDSSQGHKNRAFEVPPGFQGQSYRPSQGHQMPDYQYPFGLFPGQMPPGRFPLFRMPQNSQPDQKNMPSGQNMPFNPGMMGMPMFIDPHTGQPFPLPGFPHHMQQGPGEGGNQYAGRSETQQPPGPPPPYNGARFAAQGRGQGIQSKAVSDQDEMMQKLKAKVDKESHEDYEDAQEHHYDTISEEGREEGEEQQRQPEEKPTKIVVTNLPSYAHEEYLEMFFENTRKFGGGPVFNVEYDEESSSAVVEFEKPEAVDIVLDKRPIKMMGSAVEVDIYTPEEPLPRCTIEVTGPCNIICEEQVETLSMYFESERRAGGGEVVDCRFDFENNMVLVTLESEEVAQRVEERASRIVMKERLQVKLHVPYKKSKKRDEDKNEEIEEPAPEPIKTVKVKGVDKGYSKDTIEFYFENRRRSGGGEIEKIESDEEEEDVLYVTFTKAEDAENVSRKTTHRVEGRTLQVSLYEPPKPQLCYENKILIKDFDDFEEVFAKHNLEGASLKVTPVAVSNCIIVANLPQDVTCDTVKYYFENERRTGGGPVDNVTMNDDDTCLVYFHDYSVIERVLQRKQKLGGQKLDVRLYQDSLGKPEGGPSERKLRIPEPIVLNDVDPLIVKFMNLSQVNHDALNVQLSDCFTSIQWPKDKGDVILECTVTTSTKNCFKIVKQWKENALKNFHDFIENIKVTRVSVLQNVWAKVMEELNSVNISNPEAVAVFVDKNEGFITVVGYRKLSENIAQICEDITKKAMNEKEKEQEKVKEEKEREKVKEEKEREKVKEVIKSLKTIETRILLADKFPEKMEEQFPDLKVKINQNKNEIVFEGPLGQIRDAKLKMYESKSSFANFTTDKLPALSLGLFVLKQTKDHIVKRLKAKKVTAVWEVTDGCLVVYSTSGENINECVDIVRGSVIENTIALKKASKSVVNSEKWQNRIDEIHAYSAGKCHIKVSDDSSKVHLCATDDIALDILDNIIKFLRLNTVTEIKISCTKNIHKLIEKHHKQQLTNISKDLQNSHVQIASVPGYGGFEVHGTEDGIQEARSRLNALFQRVKHHEHTVQKPGLAEHMQTPKGKDNLHNIETAVPYVIAVKGDNLEENDENPYDFIPHDSDVSENIGIKVRSVMAHCRVYDCRNIYTVKGDMTELSAEMLVNQADKKLSLTGGLGKTLVQKGGNVILKECGDYIRSEGSLGDGDVFVSSAGKLKAEHIAHVIGPVWKGGLQEEEKMVEKAVFKCLQQASTRSLNSIAIPAISSGTFGYPVKKATSTIVVAVKNFFREVQDSSVTDIYLCDMKLNTVEGFNEALQREFARDFHKYQPSEEPHSAHGRSKKMSYDDDDSDDELKPLNSDDEYEYFHSQPYRKSKEVFAKHHLEGASLKVTPVAMSNCIIVANLPQDVTSDTVKYYFENERRTGGGPVDNVTMNDDDTCLVYFHDYSVIERVLQRKQKLGGQQLDMRLYQDSLGKPEGGPSKRKLRIPEPVVLNEVDPLIVKFMNLSQVHHDALNVQLSNFYTSVQWPKDKGNVILECTVTTTTKDCFKIVKQWKENALKNFHDFIKNIKVTRVLVLQNVWAKVMEELKSVNISNREAVAVFVDKNEGFIAVVGYSKLSENIAQKCKEITKKAMAEAEKEREKVKEKKEREKVKKVITSLKTIETRIFLADKFPEKMEEQFSDLKVKINQNKNEIVFEGPLGQIRDAKLKMYESKSTFANFTTDKLPELSLGLYVLKQTKDHIVKRLKAKQVTAVWKVTDGCLVVCSTSMENINECVDIVRGSVIENTIALKKASKSVVNSEKWQNRIDEIHAYSAGKCHIKVSEDSSKVHLCATDDIFLDILDNIIKFLRLNTVTEIKISCTKNSHKLIIKHHKQEVTNIVKDLLHSHVQIASVPGYGGFEVHGTEDGIQEARSRLNALIQRVKHHEHTVQKPGLAEHMQTPKGKDNLHTIETAVPCVIAVKGDNLEENDENPYDFIPHDSDVSENIGIKGLSVMTHCGVYDCRNVYTVKGDMTELSAEMLVNQADKKLSLTGGLGKALVQKDDDDDSDDELKLLNSDDEYEDFHYQPYGKSKEKQSDADHLYERLPGDKGDSDDDDGTYMFGTIAVSVKQGDIMTEDADCIVNSSNEELDLSRGVVSHTLLKRCGQPLTKETASLKKEMKKKHIVVTSAPNLSCKNIIHVVAKETLGEWKDLIEKCLYTAEKRRFESIAFPALGTGIQMAPSDIAEAMARAIKDFQSSQPTSVKDVRLVIFQQKMVEDFHRTIKLACKGNVAKGQRQYEHGAGQERRKTLRDPNKVTFLIFSMTESNIQEAIKKLEACLEKEVHTKTFKDSIIKKMDDNQIMELKAIALQHHLELEIEPSQSLIRIGGIAQNVMTASDRIHRIMRDAATLEQLKNSGALMSNLVQWSYIEISETGQTLQPYEKELNYKIETAYISKAETVKFRADDVPYVLDFDKMVEYPKEDDSDTVTVLRRDLVCYGAFKQPPLWADMTGNLRVVVLQPTDQEYKDISQKFIASAGSSFNVVKVERVQNKTLWLQYQAKKKLLEDQNPPNTTNEMLLWHGTAVEAVDNINAYGFNRSYCGKNATMYGDGVYFAVSAQYSCRNTYSRQDSSGVKRMYYCRVLTGEYTQGKQGMRVPPNKGGAGSTALYDSVVDRPGTPGIFIIFHDTQAYPEYLVSFKPQ